nr:MAG TPA: Protein of unknown function (DUF1029) [Caudoviricetes sp.]
MFILYRTFIYHFFHSISSYLLYFTKSFIL